MKFVAHIIYTICIVLSVVFMVYKNDNFCIIMLCWAILLRTFLTEKQ